jgi:hypothetical protein
MNYTDKTTRGLNTAKLKRPPQITPMAFMLVCFLLAAAACFFLTARNGEKKPDTTYKTPSELYIEHEAKATKELLKQESEKTKKANKAKFVFE